MESRKKVSIYYDPDSISNHNPDFGTLECGARTALDIPAYDHQGYTVVYPERKAAYFKIMADLHTANPTFQYLIHTPLRPNFLQRVFKIKPKSRAVRNCHKCTTQTDKEICAVCGVHRDESNFYKYVHSVDPTISDSDTTYITDTTDIAVKNACSLVCQMIDDIAWKKTSHGFAIVRPPGHHACHNKSQGFCIVNNIAICALYAKIMGYHRIFIFDFDAHHGNGTQEIFYRRRDVYYCSMHTDSAYPRSGLPEERGAGNGLGCNLNIIVPKGIGGDAYLDIYKSKVLPEIAQYKPELILVSAGFDGLATDPMAIMKLTPTCYGEIIALLTQFDIPIGMVLEGGYDRNQLATCYDICLASLRSDVIVV